MSTSWYKPSAVPRLIRTFPTKGRKLNLPCRNSQRDDNTLATTPLTLFSSEPSASIEIWNTTCIVTNFGKSKESACSVLINPSNPSLTGVKKFPYFPRGGPEPKEQPKKYEHHIMGYVSQWGGMEVGAGMLFSANVVDGLVHQLGGWELQMHCQLLPNLNTKNEKCLVGHAVSTPPGGKPLREQYDTVIHTVPPFFQHDDEPEFNLARCYQNALSLAFSSTSNSSNPVSLQSSLLSSYEILSDIFSSSNRSQSKQKRQRKRVAIPLLGAGARGFPLEDAIQIAANESVLWRDNINTKSANSDESCDNIDEEKNDKGQVLAFGIPNMSVAKRLIEAIENVEMNQHK